MEKDLSGSNITSRIHRIGFFGGSFNPVHYGHLILAETARIYLDLENIIFIPSGKPCYNKEENPIEANHRLNMLKLALSSNKYFSVSEIEIKKNDPSYTINTLTELSKFYDTEKYDYHYLIGADQALELIHWKSPYEILNLTKIVIAKRPGFPIDQIYSNLKSLNNHFDRIIIIDIMQIGISSRIIRKRIRDGSSIKYLLPLKVENYINKKNLYKE